MIPLVKKDQKTQLWPNLQNNTYQKPVDSMNVLKIAKSRAAAVDAVKNYCETYGGNFYEKQIFFFIIPI